MMKKEPADYQCPTCRKKIEWDKNNPYRPFCSKRCRLIDLGEWAKESYAVPGEKQPTKPTEESE